jgi:hypothetical protein
MPEQRPMFPEKRLDRPMRIVGSETGEAQRRDRAPGAIRPAQETVPTAYPAGTHRERIEDDIRGGEFLPQQVQPEAGVGSRCPPRAGGQEWPRGGSGLAALVEVREGRLVGLVKALARNSAKQPEEKNQENTA